jgi:hypothetical protein
MTVGEERKIVFGADRDSLTGLPLAPLLLRPLRSGREERKGLNSLQASAGLEESQFLKPQIRACCNALMATRGSPAAPRQRPQSRDG